MIRGKKLSGKQRKEFIKRAKEDLGALRDVLPDKSLESYLAYVAARTRVAPMNQRGALEKRGKVMWSKNQKEWKTQGVNHTIGYEVPGRGFVPSRFYVAMEPEIMQDWLRGGEKGRQVFWHEMTHGILNAAGYGKQLKQDYYRNPEKVEHELTDLYSVYLDRQSARRKAKRMMKERFEESVAYLTHRGEEAVPDMVSMRALAKMHGNKRLTPKEIRAVTGRRPWPVKLGIYRMLEMGEKGKKMGLFEKASKAIERAGKVTDTMARMKRATQVGEFWKRRQETRKRRAA